MGIQGVRFELKLFNFHEEFSEKLSGKANKSPPLWKFEPLSRNPGSALADLPSRHTSLTQHRIKIDSTPYIESMLSQGYVPAWCSESQQEMG